MMVTDSFSLFAEIFWLIMELNSDVFGFIKFHDMIEFDCF